MYFSDHPPPHFHVFYGEYEAAIDIERLEIRDGALPRRVQRPVLRWAETHRTELYYAWDQAGRHEPLDPIPPPE